VCPTRRSMAMKESKGVMPIHHNSSGLGGHLASGRTRKVRRVEGRDRRMVENIVKPDEIEQYVQRMREKYYTLADHALAAIRHALEVDIDAKLASLLLNDIDVVPSKTDPQGVPLREAETMIPAPFSASPRARIVAETQKFDYKN
jgi:hypothetical protein